MKFIHNWAEWEAERISTENSPHNDALLPCPLCNGKARIHFSCAGNYYKDGGRESHAHYRAVCVRCGLCGSHRLSPYHAAVKWNKLAERIRDRIAAG